MGNVLVLVENSKFVGVVYNKLKESIKHDVKSLSLGTKNAAIRTEKDNYLIEIKGDSVRKQYFDKVIDFTFDGLMSKVIEDRIENEFVKDENLLEIEKIIETTKKFEGLLKECGSISGNKLKTSCGCECGIKGYSEEGKLTLELTPEGKLYIFVNDKSVGHINVNKEKYKWDLTKDSGVLQVLDNIFNESIKEIKTVHSGEVELKGSASIKNSPQPITININMAGTDVNQAKSLAKEFVETLKKKAGKSD